MRGTWAAIALVLLTSSCGAPPGLEPSGDAVREPSPQPPQATTGLPPGYTPRPTPPATPVPTPFPEYTAVDCAGRVTKEQVIAVVRRETDIEPGEAITAPVCAGTWHYTLLSVPGREPVKVLTKTAPSGLTLVVVGTDVCSLDIQHQAPSGIYTAASC